MKQAYIPAVTKNPVKLAVSLLFSDNPAARSALYFAALGVACAPVDFLLQTFEKRRIKGAGPPSLPIFLVAGPPRSGTTLVAQYLINCVNSCYLNNLTSVFPRSPLTVNAMWGKRSIAGNGSFSAFYGRSRGLRGANDGLHIWDRWLGADRSEVPKALAPGSEQEIPKFFGALQHLYGLPVINKVNRLNLCANLIAPLLPQARFIFINRQPFDLAQSLLRAREQIAGDPSRAYGTQHPDAEPDDHVKDVCRQIKFHSDCMARQRALMPAGQVIEVQYEDFCASPREFVGRITASTAGVELRKSAHQQPEKFKVSNRPKVPAETMARLKQALVEMGLV